MPNVFISYVRANAALVDRLADEFRAHGVTVWLDRDKIMPGQRWQDAIRQAIREGDYFIACFSAEYVARPRTYMHTEIGLAIEMLQQMPTNRIWFIPVLLSECEVPDRSIGGGQMLRDLHWEPLYKDWERGVRRVITAMGVERSLAEPAPAKLAKPPRPDLLITDPLRLELVRVPAGEFLMGSDPARDKGAWDDEKPQHRLSLSEFYIGKYPVTVSQFAVFAQAQSYQTKAERDGYGWVWSGKEWKQEKGASWRHPRGPKSDVSAKGDHPVTQVTWHDAMEFCAWVSQASGEVIRLPSEAEWEQGARGVDGRVYPWGNEVPTGELCNFFGSKIGDTSPVDRYSKGASPYSALDMAGNVWEWTLSLWGKDVEKPQFGYPYNPTDGRENLLVDIDIRYVVRGGSFIHDDRLVRCACRGYDNPNHRHDNIGFRLVRVSAPS